MVSKLFKFLNRDVATMNQAALLLAVFSLVSQLCGLLRDHLLASLVGPSAHLDIYYSAFRIPDFLYNSFGCLFSVTVLIPFITEHLRDGESGKVRFKKFSDSVYSIYMIGMTIVLLAVFILMPLLTRLTAPGFGAAEHAQLVLFSRIMLLSPFLMGLASLLGSFAQVQKKFFSYAIAPVFYNVGILIGVILLRPFWGMEGVVIGVALGALLYLLIQLPPLFSLHSFPRLTLNIDLPLIKRVMALSLPRTLGSSLSNITFIIISAIASLLVAGSISIFQFSYNIETTPLMMVGISYAVAAFPTLTRLFGEGLKSEAISMVHRATRNIAFLSIPASLLMIVLRAQIVRVLLGAGEFSWNDTRLVAASLALFCLSITAQCMVLLMVRAFFAKGDTKTPLWINGVAVGVTAIAAIGLLLGYHYSPMFADFTNSMLRIDDVVGASVVMLPLAFSIGQIVNAIMLWGYFHRHLRVPLADQRELGRTLWHMLGAGIISAGATYAILALVGTGVDQTRFMGVLLQGVLGGIFGLAIYAGILYLLKNEDVSLFLQTLQSKFWKQKPLAPGQQDL